MGPQRGQIRNVSSQELRRFVGINRIFPQSRRDQPALAVLICRRLAPPGKITAAGQNHKQIKMFWIRKSFSWRADFPSFGCEIAAGSEQRILHPVAGQMNPGGLAANGPAELNYIQGFLNLKFSRLPLRIHTSIVVDAIRQVRIFLDLTKDHSRANCMWCARWNEERVSWLYSPVNKEIFQSLSFDGCQKIFRFNLRHESNEHMRSWPGGNGMPHFCLAAPARGLVLAGRPRR